MGLVVTVIGGCGHVGLPLALALADSGVKCIAYDTNSESVATVNAGAMPFLEADAQGFLDRVIAAGTFTATTDPQAVSQADVVVLVIGTPVDEHLNPDPLAIRAALEACLSEFRDGQLVILRSTVYPGVTEMVHRLFREAGLDVDVAFCPERIAEGYAMEELHSLPQIVAGTTTGATDRASELFGRLTTRIIVMSPMEAEMAKLFTNAWRYIKFATANQFFMLAHDRGLDYERIRQGLMADYPRARDLPGAGFAAGPCLLKDTMQLAAFSDNTFTLGHSAMLVNEGLPLYLVSSMEERFDLASMTVGILGMAFKAESDDIRSSLSYKLKRLLRFRARRVLCSDPYVTTDPELLALDDVVAQSDALVIGAPHHLYADLRVNVPVIDIWHLLDRRVDL